MTILYWDKPQKVMTTEEWQGISADSAPPGVYSPNMSDEDNQRFKAKFVGGKVDMPRVEIRKAIGNVQALIVVSLGDGFGVRYGYDLRGKDKSTKYIEGASYNIRMSLNGSAYLTWQDWQDVNTAIAEAKVYLENWKKQNETI